jgi:hypothetical protein
MAPDRQFLLKFVADTDKADKTLRRFGKVIVGALAVDKILDFGKAAITMADDVDQAEGKLGQLLGRQAKVVKSFAKNSKAIGLSRRNTLKYTSSLAALMRVQGATQREAASSSIRWTKLAADMAAFNNASPEEVLIGMQAALAGEFDPLKRMGVLLNATKVQQEAYRMGIAKTGQALTDRQKLLATESLLLRQTRLQQGQLGRESDTLGAKQNRLNAMFEDMQLAIGEQLLGPMSSLASLVADDIAPALGNMSGAIGKITGLGQSAGASILILAGALGILAAIAVAHPILAIAAAIGALAIAAALVVNSGVLKDFHDQAIGARYALMSGQPEEVSPLERALLGLYDAMNIVGGLISGFFSNLATVFRTGQEFISGDFSGWLDGLVAMAWQAFTLFTIPFQVAFGVIEAVATQFGVNLSGTIGWVRDTVVRIFQNLVGTIRDIWNSLDFSIPAGSFQFTPGIHFDTPFGSIDIPRIGFDWAGTGDLVPDVGGRSIPAPASLPKSAPPRHLHGLSRVPTDNYLMLADRGEAVLTRSEAREWRGGSTGAVNLNVSVAAPIAADGARVGADIIRYLDQAFARGHRLRYSRI